MALVKFTMTIDTVNNTVQFFPVEAIQLPTFAPEPVVPVAHLGSQETCPACNPGKSFVAPTDGEFGETWLTEDDFLDNMTEFYSIRVLTNRALTDEEARQVFGCIGYSFRKNFRGESLGFPERKHPWLWEASYDITKSQSDDWAQHFEDALADARQYAVEGSPKRIKDGERLVEGVGPITLTFFFC